MTASRPPHRVLQLTSSSAIGGTEQMVLSLAKALQDAQFRTSIASIDGPGLLTQAAQDAGIRAENWRMKRLWRPDLLEIIRSRLRGQFDLIHTYGLRADLLGRLLKPWLGPVRLVCGIRSIDEGRATVKVLLDRATARNVDLFIANSEAGRRMRIGRERIPPDRIITIHNGIDPARHSSGDKAVFRGKYGIAASRFPVIAHVANLRAMKGHETALEAAAMLKQSWPELLILFAGRDDSGGKWQSLAQRLGVAENVRFMGYVPQSREIFQAADLSILPSSYEGCPVAILEAMAEECPIIASNVGGIPELVRHEQDALLIPPRNAAALAKAIRTLAEDPAFSKQLSQAARARLDQEFTLGRMIEKYREAYRGLLQ